MSDLSPDPATVAVHCARCGATFRCAMSDPSGSKEPCWCTFEPPRAVDARYQRCLCPSCLRGQLVQCERMA